MLTIALGIASISLAFAFALTMVRVILGPTIADRVLALDTLAVIAVGIVLVTGFMWGTTLYVEIAILIALLGFVATVATARYLTYGSIHANTDTTNDEQ